MTAAIWHYVAVRLAILGGDMSGQSLFDQADKAWNSGNVKKAFQLFMQAAEAGDTSVFNNIGYFFDHGLAVKRSKAKALHWYKKAFRHDRYSGASNIATVYRDAGDLRRAFKWWQTAAKHKDGDAFLELGYCYQYGIGVRRNLDAACKAYRAAVHSKWISDYDREEAQYHLAIACLDADLRGRKRAATLLAQAAADGDYPQASQLLERIECGRPLRICRCRRGLLRKYGGKAQCPLHAGLKRRKST